MGFRPCPFPSLEGAFGGVVDRKMPAPLTGFGVQGAFVPEKVSPASTALLFAPATLMSATTSSTVPGPLTALGVKVTVTSLIGEPASRLLTTAEALIGAPTVSVVMLNVETPAASGLYVTRSEEHTSELQSLMRNSYAVFCLKKKT